MLGDEFGVGNASLRPERQFAHARSGDNLGEFNDLADLALVQVEAIAGSLLHVLPAGLLKIDLTGQGYILKIRKVGFESIENSFGEASDCIHRHSLLPARHGLLRC